MLLAPVSMDFKMEFLSVLRHVEPSQTATSNQRLVSIFLSIYLSFYLSFYLFIYYLPTIYLSLYLLSTCTLIYLSVSIQEHEYLENSCIDSEELTCPYQRTDNAYPRFETRKMNLYKYISGTFISPKSFVRNLLIYVHYINSL